MKIPQLKTKDFLTLADYSKEDIINLFEYSAQLKREVKKGKFSKILENRTLAMIFEKNSTRTRVSFETGMLQLGGNALFLSSNEIQLGRGETIADTARVLSRYNNGIMIRTFGHEKVTELAKWASIPVINGLTDSYHPCQALADYFTIFEREKDITKTKLTYIGDGNNVANSLLMGAAILGCDIAVATPKKFEPEYSIVEKAYKLAAKSSSKITITNNIDEAVEGADYLYTDVWVSMGQEKETAKKKKIFGKFKIDDKLIKKTGKDAKVLHCLPAHRGEEITDEVMDGKHSIVFDQAENRLHCQKAVMCALMGR
ncbi:MAG TPA: ornithine carbamoyltransferase [Spirochaetota bacterium]|mgnify:FL=1|nr:ornithine carbamoyltransferase [Spirochaetota bacterium]HPJ43723.1 ornithine carbamoyltransferase [Spirochaetota bacterium]HPR38601.1 ornithine carbamoyltransferase [Spirochaetota bacterium]